MEKMRDAQSVDQPVVELQEKMPYSRPKLERHGLIENITQVTTGPSNPI
jgi:hypothetical protein